MRKTIFVKYSNERSEEFSIRTVICMENAEKKVIKTPCSEKAEKHVKNNIAGSKAWSKSMRRTG